jgi:hypothetical protein
MKKGRDLLSIVLKLRKFARKIAIILRFFVLTKLYKMDIHTSSVISFGARLDKTYPGGGTHWSI